MLLAKASIGRKLLIAFSAMALLLFVSSVIGVLGFKQVSKTERNVVNKAIPSMVQARQVSELSSKILTSVQNLTSAKNEVERQASGQALFSQLEALLKNISDLGAESFNEQLLTSLADKVQNIINNLAELGILVERRLSYEQEIKSRATEMRALASELETLTGTQVANTSTVTIANVTHIYDLIEQQKVTKAITALDTLVEVDLDLSERLHEMHLLAFKLLNHIEESLTLNSLERTSVIHKQFVYNLEVMSRRAKSVEDPTRSEQMVELLHLLRQKSVLFDLIKIKLENEQASQLLTQETFALFDALNTTVNRLVDQANASSTHAITKLKTTLDYAQLSLILIPLMGFAIVVLIVWKLVYVSVLTRLARYSSALQSVSQGQLSFELNIQGNDELANMGRAIINARDTAKKLKVVAESEAKAKNELQEHKLHLEELVVERTEQLQNANTRLNEEVINHARAQKEAEQASRAKSAFLATMSHEIRTPMNGVLGTARLLQESALNKEQRHYVEVINRSGNALLALLNDILDYSKIEAGHLTITPVNFDIFELVNDVGELFKAKAIEKGLSFNYVIEKDVYPYRFGDKNRIGQVFANLIGNAVKFTEDGHIDISLYSEHPESITFEVSDTGIGIEDNAQKQLFKAFSQATNEITAKEGTGLGLAISQHIIEAMKGDLRVESVFGQGSTFYVTLPLAHGELIERQTACSKKSGSFKILLVEDNPVNQLVATGFLEILGHEVRYANNGEAALVAWKEEEFDFALLDINLPDCNGMELLSSMKNQKEASGTVFIAVSAHVFHEEVDQYIAAGFESFLPKPLDKDQLEATISHFSDASNHTCSTKIDVPTSNLIDPSVVLKDIEILGHEKMTEIVEMFSHMSQELLSELHAAKASSDEHQITQLAHKLKGSASSLGLVALSHACLTIEKSPKPLEALVLTEIEVLVQSSISALFDMPGLQQEKNND